MQSPDHRQAADVSAGQAGGESDTNSSRQAALAVNAWWHAVSDSLAPMLGLRGVSALYQRTVHLAAGTHPFLASAEGELDLPALQALLAQQPESAITAAGATLASTLSSLLEGLVGPSLTQRLLHDVQAPTTAGNPAQDPPR